MGSRVELGFHFPTWITCLFGLSLRIVKTWLAFFSNLSIQLIRLHRGPSGLGFSIVGGKGSKHGDLPIYVKSVFEEAAAGKDGRLRTGDQLLSVNGYSFENITHEQAAETLKLLKGDIELNVLRTE